MKLIWKVNGRRYLLGVGRNEECPCGSHMKFKWCCIDKSELPALRRQSKKPLDLSEHMRERLALQQVTKAARQQRFKRIARATKRYNAKMTRRNYNEVHTN